MMRLLPLFVLLLCSSCIQLGSESLPIRYYLLEPTAERLTENPPQVVQLKIDPINFPPYLDRPNLISRDRDNQIIIAEHDRWAEALPDNFVRTLQENLVNQNNTLRISSAPWHTPVDKGFSIELIINRFDGIIAQQTEVDIRWTLFAVDNKTELLRDHFIARLPIGDSYQALVSGLNKALAQLSNEITAALSAQSK